MVVPLAGWTCSVRTAHNGVSRLPLHLMLITGHHPFTGENLVTRFAYTHVHEHIVAVVPESMMVSRYAC